ncbi:hypothetical protein B0H14DRAFT_3903025 [Mycena olivaceomarginata]|nr:hypothetical protein B0H14DRAFT_3903025 [Mycena olivaceomarginata]
MDAPPHLSPPKLHKKPMDPMGAPLHTDIHAAQEQRKIAEEERRKQDLMFERQGLKTLRLNMANYPELLKKMGLTDTDEIGIYDFDGRCWDREDVNHVREVVPREGPPRAPLRGEGFGASLLAAFLSGVSGVFSIIHVPLFLLCAALPFPHPKLVLFATVACLTTVAPLATIFNLSISCGTWPEGMYVRDMLTGFRLVGSKNVADRFASVFGRTFPHGAWYQQQRAWKYSSQEERDHAAQLPRTSDGLWSTWRSTSSGWARRKKEAREEVEKEWAEMKRKHAVLVGAWEKECAGLTELGTKKKDLPSKPKLGKNPQLPAVDDEEDDVEKEPMEENDG